MQQLSTIGRPVDFSYKTNRAIAAITIGVVLAATVYSVANGSSLWDGLGWGCKAGLSVFLTWALCRELDPDHDLSAFVATFLALVAIPIFGLPNLGLLFWMLLSARIVNRTTGAPATLLDSLVIIAVATWLTRQFGVAVLYLTAGSLFVDAWIGPKGKGQFAMVGIAVIDAIVTTVLHWAGYYGAQSPVACLIALIFSILFTPVFIEASRVKSKDDKALAGLYPLRIQSAQVMALLSGILLALLLGQSCLKSLTPFWAVALGSPLFWVIAKMRPFRAV